VAIAQAANDLLRIQGVDASFVAVQVGTGVNISARSLGAVNVQVIMEALGGGGHQTMAAAQLKHITPEAARSRIEQVLYNLVGNAIKYTPQGKVVLSALVEGNFLRIKVTDTGIGIARDHLEHIFEPLVQMSPEVSKQGAGLGLSITRQLVHLMGGSCSWRASRASAPPSPSPCRWPAARRAA
jgi:signal transduction histidine kinase